MEKKAWSHGWVVFILVVTLTGAGLVVPAMNAALPGNSPDTTITIAILNVTNASLPGPANAPEFRQTPEPVQVRVTVSETALPAPKGEMAAGPRAIGVSLDPLVLATGVLALVVAGTGVLLYTRRKRDEENDD
jgi:hypothetical protein